MSRKVVLPVLLFFVFCFAIGLMIPFVFRPGSASQKDVTPVQEPITITVPVEPTPAGGKFAVGDKVTVDGLTLLDGSIPTLTVVAVGEVTEWTNRMTGDTVMARAYTVEITVDGQSDQITVPELVIKKAQ